MSDFSEYGTAGLIGLLRNPLDASTREAICGEVFDRYKKTRDTLSELTAELEAVRRDAERYEWLRSQGTRASEIDRTLYETVHDDCNPPYRAMKHGAALDAAIDAARGGE